MVLSSRSAAKATLALNAGICERRERRPDDFLFITNSFRLAIVGQAKYPESVFISPVQICGATSLLTCSGVISEQYIFVTHSLGSRIVFDTLLNLRNYDGVEAANQSAFKGLVASVDSDAEILPSPFHRWFAKNSNPTKLTNHIIEKTTGIYMMANQVSLIGLSQIEPSVNSADREQPNYAGGFRGFWGYVPGPC